MARPRTTTRATSMLLFAAGAAAGLALYVALRPAQARQTPRPALPRPRHPNARPLADTPLADAPGAHEETYAEAIESRVLAVFRNDPIVSERAIDICAGEGGTVELTGWVNSADEIAYAVTLTRGIPGVTAVLDLLAVQGRKPPRNHSSGNYAAVDPSLATGRPPRAD